MLVRGLPLFHRKEEEEKIIISRPTSLSCALIVWRGGQGGSCSNGNKSNNVDHKLLGMFQYPIDQALDRKRKHTADKVTFTFQSSIFKFRFSGGTCSELCFQNEEGQSW